MFRGEKRMRSVRRAHSNVSSHSAFRDDARVYMISFAIFERKDRKNKKLAVWRFYSLFLSVQYDDWKHNKKEDQQKQYSCIKNTPE